MIARLSVDLGWIHHDPLLPVSRGPIQAAGQRWTGVTAPPTVTGGEGGASLRANSPNMAEGWEGCVSASDPTFTKNSCIIFSPIQLSYGVFSEMETTSFALEDHNCGPKGLICLQTFQVFIITKRWVMLTIYPQLYSPWLNRAFNTQ